MPQVWELIFLPFIQHTTATTFTTKSFYSPSENMQPNAYKTKHAHLMKEEKPKSKKKRLITLQILLTLQYYIN